MPTARTRLAALAAAGVLGAVGLAAAATPATADTAAAASAAVQRVSPCGNSALAVTRTFAQGGAGHSWLSLIYRNTTTRSCTLSGYPGLDAVSRSGRVLAHAARTPEGYGGGGGHLRTVTLRPGGFASAGVEWLNFNGHTGGTCRFSAAFTTTVANTTRAHHMAFSVSICGLQVHPTVAGTPQYPHYGPAQYFWLAGAKVDSAGMNYYFDKAKQQLSASRRFYTEQIKELTQLASLPETGLTKKQIKRARADVTELDSFFATPRLYS